MSLRTKARTNKAERTAAQAWEYLSSAVAAAGDSARDAGRQTADLAGAKATLAGAKAAELADRAGRQGGRLADAASRKSSKLAGTAGRRGSAYADKAGKRASKAADRASGKVNAVADEAWARANAAAGALAGRKPGLPWGLIVGVGLLGAALGWAAASTAKAAIQRQAENEELELAETAVIVTPAADTTP